MKIKEKLENHKTFIQTTYRVREIGVFGSMVTGTSHDRSDIDILVEFEDGHKDLFNYMKLKNYLENLLGRKVDLVMKKAIKERIRERILHEVEYV
jgi:uncharacterized protein